MKKLKDKLWAIKVKEMAGGKCAICGKTEYLNAHHIIPREVADSRWEPLNGIALCPLHHKFSREISAHKNPLAFFAWMTEHRETQLKLLLSKCKK